MTTEKTRVLPESILLRVQACGIIFQSEKPEKIKAVADGKEISMEEAGIRYTIGCIKSMKRHGIANSYREALDILEARQAGDTGNMFNPPNTISRTVERINRKNRGNTYNPDYITGIAAFTTTIDDRTVYGPMEVTKAHFPAHRAETRQHNRSLGKVYGSFYTQWEHQEAESDPDRILIKSQLEAVLAYPNKHIRRFMIEYVSRLSRTAKKRIQEIKDSPEKSAYLASRVGIKDPKVKNIAIAAMHLHENFPHKDAITRREYIDLIRKYVPDMLFNKRGPIHA
jgi:hypothetical protein